MKRILVILPFLFIVGCASVATGIDTARNVVATTVQTGMQAGADMVGAVAEDVSDENICSIHMGGKLCL